MIAPDLKDLMARMDSRYTLVVASAKRARQLAEGYMRLTSFDSEKPVTLAVHEIAEGKINYSRESMPKRRTTGYGKGEAFDLFETSEDREPYGLFGAHANRSQRDPRAGATSDRQSGKFGVFGAPGAAAGAPERPERAERASEQARTSPGAAMGSGSQAASSAAAAAAIGGLFMELSPDYVESMRREEQDENAQKRAQEKIENEEDKAVD